MQAMLCRAKELVNAVLCVGYKHIAMRELLGNMSHACDKWPDQHDQLREILNPYVFRDKRPEIGNYRMIICVLYD